MEGGAPHPRRGQTLALPRDHGKLQSGSIVRQAVPDRGGRLRSRPCSGGVLLHGTFDRVPSGFYGQRLPACPCPSGLTGAMSVWLAARLSVLSVNILSLCVAVSEYELARLCAGHS
ncbi:hypothetical protein GCM10010331_16180 [Streptomyces xanthochromogenes]|nr:hypothetical protein GCM10010331_16180 [Streptomyces xanthochromogenes]